MCILILNVIHSEIMIRKKASESFLLIIDVLADLSIKNPFIISKFLILVGKIVIEMIKDQNRNALKLKYFNIIIKYFMNGDIVSMIAMNTLNLTLDENKQNQKLFYDNLGE